MTVRLYAFTCGWITAPRAAFVAGESAVPIKIPVPAYLIVHPRGRAVVDTGVSLAIRTDPRRVLGDAADTYRTVLPAGEAISERLQALDVAPDRVELMINTHCHFDHAGGNAQLPNAKLVIQKREWEACVHERSAAKNFLDPNVTQGHARLEADGELDLFGDGSVTLLPTFGHTPGHQSVRIRGGERDTILAGDTCYFCRTLDDEKLPNFGHDLDEQRRSIRRLRALRDDGHRIIPGHDPEYWAALPQAPAALV